MRNKVIRAGVIFLVIAALCTVISRGLYVASIANVTLQTPRMYTLNHDIETYGIVEQSREFVVLAQANQIVTDIYVKTGQEVKVGDPLFAVDMEYLGQQIDSLENEIAQLEYQIRDAKNQEADRRNQEALAQKQAKENYDRTAAKWEKQLAKDAKAVEDARRAYEESLKKKPENGDEQAGVAQAEQDQLLAALKEAEAQYEASVSQKEDELFTAGQNLESSKVIGADSTSEEQLQLQKEQTEKNLSQLTELADREGKIVSSAAGMVSEILVRTGEFTPSTASVLVADMSSGIKLTVTLGADEAKYVGQDSGATIRGKDREGKEAVLTNVEIRSIKEKKESEDSLSSFEAVITSPETVFAPGTNVSVEIRNQSAEYDTCIPLQALHEEGADRYAVYITEEKDTMIGKELVARKVMVKVIDQDAEFAAVDSDTLSSQQNIIYTSDKTIEDGTTVREKD